MLGKRICIVCINMFILIFQRIITLYNSRVSINIWYTLAINTTTNDIDEDNDWI